MIDPEIIEILANGEHEQWMELMRYLGNHDMSLYEYITDCQGRGLFEPYSKLTEKQQASDIKFAKKTINDLNSHGYVIVGVNDMIPKSKVEELVIRFTNMGRITENPFQAMKNLLEELLKT